METSEYHIPMGGRPLPYRDALAVPISNEGPPLGVLSIESTREVFEAELDRYLIQTLADILASALRLLDERGVKPADLLLDA